MLLFKLDCIKNNLSLLFEDFEDLKGKLERAQQAELGDFSFEQVLGGRE